MAIELNHIKVISTTNATVGNGASVTVLAANNRRLYAEIVNSSANGIWLNFGEDAVVGQGIYLAPSGFSFIINSEFMWRGTVTAIAVAGAANVLGVIEGQ